MAFNWTCPHCQTLQTVVDRKFSIEKFPIDVGETILKKPAYEVRIFGCSNEEGNYPLDASMNTC